MEEVGESSGGDEEYYWPTESTRINTNYPYDGTEHLGIDILPKVLNTAGDKVYAYANGYVAFVRDNIDGNPNEGYTVRIHHNNPIDNGYERIRTQYMHLNSAPLVTAGQNVSGGELIGYMGTTGNSTGVHLHFEVRGGTANQFPIGGKSSGGYKTGTPLDPTPYLDLT